MVNCANCDNKGSSDDFYFFFDEEDSYSETIHNTLKDVCVAVKKLCDWPQVLPISILEHTVERLPYPGRIAFCTSDCIAQYVHSTIKGDISETR